MRKVIVATYKDLHTARQVIEELVKSGVERGDAGLAVNENPSAAAGALVTVTTPENRLDQVNALMRNYGPVEMDERDIQWRVEGRKYRSPDVDQFTAVERMEGSDDATYQH